MNKKIVMIKKINGRKPLDIKAKELQKCGKLVSQIKDPFDGSIKKYYSLTDLGISDQVTEVYEKDGQILSITNKSSDILKIIPPIDVPMFGGF
jgi:hypothetical protein